MTLQPPSPTVKNEAARCSETLVNFLQTTVCAMLEDIIHGQYPTSHADMNSIKGKGKGKGKAVPLQAWSGPEDSRKLRFPDFMTTAQDGGKVVSRRHRPPLPPRNAPGTHFC